MPYKKYEDSVDQILENLKQQPAPKDDSAVDHILAGLGFESAQPLAGYPAKTPAENVPASTASTAGEQQPFQDKPADDAVRRTVRRADVKPASPAPAVPELQKPAAVQKRENEEAAELRSRFEQAAVPEAGDEIQAPSFQVSESLRVNELIDEEFTRFFSESVAVMPDDDEDNRHRHSLFNRFIRKRKAEEFPDAAEDETIMMPGLSDPDDTCSIQLDLGNMDEREMEEAQLADQDLSWDDEEDDASEDYDEEAYEEYDEEPRRKKHSLFALRLFGNREDEDGEPDDEFYEDEPEDEVAEEAPETDGPFEDEDDREEPIEDYAKPEDAPAVQADLSGMRMGWSLRTALSGILSLALLYLGLTAAGILPAIQAIDPQRAAVPFLAVNLIFLIADMALAWDILRDGIMGLFGRISGQTMPVLAAICAGIQLVVLIIKHESYDPEKITLFAAPAALLLCLALLGRTVMARVVERNFQTVSQGADHAAAYQVRSRELTEKIAQGLGEEDPQLLVSRPTSLVKGFLQQSFSQAPSDGLAQKLSWVLLAVGIVAGGVCLAKGLGLAAAMSVLAGTMVLGSPLSSTLLAAVPCLMMQKSAARVGAVIPGWSAVEELGNTNMVMANARDLFPPHSVLLHGIKTFEKERIDLAILYAASILVQACDTLQDVFMNIIQGKTDMLYPVENLNCEVGCGFTGWIEHNRVIIGNRRMMEKHEIELPSMDYEKRYTKGVRQPIYLAVSGKLFGMFVVSYRADDMVDGVLHNLHHAGVSVLVKSDDFSITSDLVASVYNLPEGSVKVLTEQDRNDLAPATAFLPQSEGCLTHIGSFASMVGGLQAAEGAAGGERAGSLVQAVGVGFSCALALLLTITGGLAGLALPAVILYQIAWSALVLAMPLLKKY